MHEPGVLNGGADLSSDSRDELLVSGAVGLMRATVGEIHDADRLTAGGSGPHDRYRQHLSAPVRALGIADHFSFLHRHRMLSAEHAGRDAFRIIHANWHSSAGIGPYRRDHVE